MYLRDCLVEKIRAVEAQFKENQHRTQGIEKTVDILERSHEMLKYDFDRSSGSLSNIRTANTKEKTRDISRFAEGRQSTPGLYEEKIDEIFNEMDNIKKDYSFIQTKFMITRDEEGSASSHNLQLPF